MKVLLFWLGSLFIAGSVLAQVPNYDFEQWDSSSSAYKVPVGWDNMNPVTTATSVYTCERLSPGYTNDYYIALNTEAVPGMGIVGGIAVSGLLDPVTHQPKSGFPFTSRPNVLAGAWQYMPYTWDDQGYITVYLSKWNAGAGHRDTIAYTTYLLPGMVMAWTNFMLPLNYHSSANPDSAMIILSASGPIPVAYSFLWVDNLHLGDSATLGNMNIKATRPQILLYPNPTSEMCTVSYATSSAQVVTISLSDMSGRIVRNEIFNLHSGANKLNIDINGLAKGLYIVQLKDETGIKQEKLIIQ